MVCTEITVIAEIFQREPHSRPVQLQPQVRDNFLKNTKLEQRYRYHHQTLFFCSRQNNPSYSIYYIQSSYSIYEICIN